MENEDLIDLEKLNKDQLISKVRELQQKIKLAKYKEDKIQKKQDKHNKKKNLNFNQYEICKVAFKLSYDGKNYQGFARQNHVENTIEEHIFNALTKTMLISSIDECDYSRAGRTDKGVSAFGNVISLKVRKVNKKAENLNTTSKNLNYIKMINANLPDDIRILAVTEVNCNFNARYDCVYREYFYFFMRNTLDIEKMKAAAKKFLGEHDFRNFCKLNPANTVDYSRIIFEINIEKTDDLCQIQNYDQRGEMFYLIIRGNSFVWHQIRCIMEILFLIGNNFEEPSLIDELFNIEKNPGRPSYNFADENPLVLSNCHYDSIQFNHEIENTLESYQHFYEITVEKTIELTINLNMMKYFIKVSKDFSQTSLVKNANELLFEKIIEKNEKAQEKKKLSYKKILDRPRSLTLEETIEKMNEKDKSIYFKKLNKKIKYEEKKT